MKPLTLRAVGFGVLVAMSGLPVAAGVTPFIWTGTSGNSRWTTSSNWQGGDAPPSDGTAVIQFRPGPKNFVEVDTPADVSSLDFAGITGLVSLQAEYDDSAELTLRAAFTFSPANSDARVELGGRDASSFTLKLGAETIWLINDGAVKVLADLADSTVSGALLKLGAGALHLEGNNTFSGGTLLAQGSLSLGSATALGTGTLTVAADSTANSAARPTLFVDAEDGLSLGNAILLNGALRVAGRGDLTLTGDVLLATNTVFRPSGIRLDLAGPVAGAGNRLTLDGPGALVLRGVNTYTGGTEVERGLLIFAGGSALPATGALTVGPDGYLGFGAGTNVQADFLDRFDKANTTGALGFDHDPNSASGTLQVTSPVDLTGFAPTARLGSATSALLQPGALITPQGADYRFGGGGGSLTVASQLTNQLTPVPATRNLVADSLPELPLTVRLINTTNSFTGTVEATHSAVVFGAGVPLPVGAGNFLARSGGYIGSEDSAVAPADFLAHFPADTPGIIGFDVAPTALGARSVDLTGLNLAAFTAGAYLGTTSFGTSETGDFTPGVVFTGTIAPGAGGTHRFTGYKGGYVALAGNLTGDRLIVGQPDTPATFGDVNREISSTVLVNGNNATALAGGTTLYGGRLLVGQAVGDGTVGVDHTHALGEGQLTVSPVSFHFTEPDGDTAPPAPRLEATAAGLILANAIRLDHELEVGGENNFTLAGTLTGAGALDVGQDGDHGFTLRLSGDNSFSGGIYLGDGAIVELATDTAAGTGPLAFGFSGGAANFESAAPTIGGLASHATSAQVNLATGSTLTITQTDDDKFDGRITGTNASIVKDGAGTLAIVNSLEHTGATTIRAGTLFAAAGENDDGTLRLGTGTVRLDGGILALASGTFLDNALTLAAGTLAGHGAFDHVTVGAGALLSPGTADSGGLGTLRFDHLALGPGGQLLWHLRDTSETDATFAQDRVIVQSTASMTLDLLAGTLANPFVIRPVSLDSSGANGIINGLDPSAGSQSWTLITYDQIVGAQTLLDPVNFSLQLDQFHLSLAGSFHLELTELTGAGELRLNFTPVPEPSAFVLLLTGLGWAAVAFRRRALRGAPGATAR